MSAPTGEYVSRRVLGMCRDWIQWEPVHIWKDPEWSIRQASALLGRQCCGQNTEESGIPVESLHALNTALQGMQQKAGEKVF